MASEEALYEIIRGDLFQNLPKNRPVLVAHICNDIGAWGAGFTAALDKHWPTVGKSYCACVSHNLSKGFKVLGLNQTDYIDNDILVVGMIAQHGLPGVHNPAPLKYGALVECMQAVRSIYLANSEGYEIHCPKFGSGIARGNWDVIESLIKELWVDQGIDVHVWYL